MITTDEILKIINYMVEKLMKARTEAPEVDEVYKELLSMRTRLRSMILLQKEKQ